MPWAHHVGISSEPSTSDPSARLQWQYSLSFTGGTRSVSVWPHHALSPGHHAPFKHTHHYRQTNLNRRRRLGPRPRRARSSSSRSQTAGIAFDNGVPIARFRVHGNSGTSYAPRVFSVISKQRWHCSNIYSAAPMPYMQRITWSGIALHAGVVPAHPASHGCIRLKLCHSTLASHQARHA